MEEFFIDKNIKSFVGKEAIDRLREKNDLNHFVPGIGVPKVAVNRWHEAQEYEYNTWCGIARGMTTDRNEEHETHFGGYKGLNSLLPDSISVIELGCGPFTNLRLILPKLKGISKINLLDPLILKYVLEVPGCPYKNGMLGIYPIKMIPSPIEKFNPSEKFDLVVMINVVEHCYDIGLIFQKIYDMMNPGGILLFGDHAEKNLGIIEKSYDAGHPIRVGKNHIEDLIKNRWEKLFINEFEAESKDNLYWILKKI